MPKRVRTRYIRIPRTSRRSRRGGLGSFKGMLTKVMVGLGAVAVGSLISSRIGIPNQYVAPAVAFATGGVIPAVVAFAAPMITQSMAPTTEERVSGNVWV